MSLASLWLKMKIQITAGGLRLLLRFQCIIIFLHTAFTCTHHVHTTEVPSPNSSISSPFYVHLTSSNTNALPLCGCSLPTLGCFTPTVFLCLSLSLPLASSQGSLVVMLLTLCQSWMSQAVTVCHSWRAMSQIIAEDRKWIAACSQAMS